MGGLNVLFSLVSVVLLSSAVRAEYYCGRSNACYMVPAGCEYGKCDFEVVWSQRQNTTKFDFKIAAKTTGWVAVGFSNDKYMGNDDVLMCIVEGNSVKFEHRYNRGRTNVAAVTPAGSVVATETLYKNGVASCRIEREMRITNKDIPFDLSSDWYIFFAEGTYVGGTPLEHADIPIMTKDKIDFSELVVLGPGHVTDNAGHVTQAGILLVLCTAVMAAFGVYQ